MAIKLEPNYPETYYYRGLSKIDISELLSSIEDFNKYF